jgi:hypothetical protein
VIGEIVSAGRRAVLRGAFGMAAAVGVGAKRSPVGISSTLVKPGFAYNVDEDPESVIEAERIAEDRARKIYDRPMFDGLDIDLAMLRSPSPSWKMTTQHKRDRARNEANRTIWSDLAALRRRVRKMGLR